MNFSRSLQLPVTHRFSSPLAFVLAALLALALLSGCAVNPATGGANLVLMSESREKEIGAEEHEKVLASMPMYDDEELLAYITKVGNRIAAVSHRPDLEYQFFIIDSPDINAMALPAGYVYVNRGLLTFMNSEAEIAAVLAHEVGHITARHAVQQQARGAIANAASAVGGLVTAVATGSGYVGSQISQVTSIWAQTGLSGFGREAELEADSLGAEYLLRAGYDPGAMIEVVTALKNQEDFNRRVQGNRGSYHGVFATHPRNDTRLQEAIAAVGQLEEGEVTLSDDAEFRKNLDGLILGESNASRQTDTRNRYYQTLLGYTVVFPDQWEVAETTTTATATHPEIGNMRVEAQRLQAQIEPLLFIRDVLGIPNLQESEALEQYRLLGHTGIYTNASGNPERIAVIYFGPRAFIIRGEIKDQSSVDDIDNLLLSSIRTFRPTQRGEAGNSREPKIRYVQASEHFDFAIIAQSSPIAEHAEQTLRLLNGYYPTGQPKAGEWIKLVE